MNATLIINGTLVGPESSTTADLELVDGKIRSTGRFDPQLFPGYEVIDARGKLLFPGAIDPHVHLALPTPAGKSSDDFVTGSKAALAGGTTTIIDFVTPRRGQSLEEAYRLRLAESATSVVNCHLHLGISEWSPRVREELQQCIKILGIRSVKAYLAYRASIGIDYPALKELMEVAAASAVLVMVHCEEGEMITSLQQKLLKEGKTNPACHAISRPPESEVRAIEKVIGLAAQTGCTTYIVHISTRGGADAIAAAKRSGIKIFAETCPHYLLLDDSKYSLTLSDESVLPFIMSPPLRTLQDQQRLWEGLSDGTFDVVATDHCPFNLYGQKDRGIDDFTKIPNGAGGIEHRLPLLYTYGVLEKRISVNHFVRLVSTNPAEIFGMGNHKGRLEPGYDADIVIWDPGFESTISVKNHYQRCDSEIYDGLKIMGKAELVIR
jgi:dihydropyrimidinase